MRNPLRKAGICLALTIFGAGMLCLAVSYYEQLGKVIGSIMGVTGLFLAIICFFVLIWTLFAAVGYARLMAGKGVIAQWHVSPDEWERFRSFDSLRAAQDLGLRNDLRVRKTTPPNGVEIIVGRRQLIVDGSYHGFRGLLRAVYWLPAPADPECLEFAVEYPRGRYGGTFKLSLRVPVPAQARADGVRVFEHYQALVPGRSKPAESKRHR